ncbi:MAG: KilA-N domain-containing protein [Sphingobacteriaceae bacterium]|nr:MAG: KilA-N domain-containing protein [Sphingobacteriaceae bacterium]
MDIIPYEYDGKTIEFFLGDEMLINATEMASVFGKRTTDFLETKGAKKTIEGMKKRNLSQSKGAKIEPLNTENAVFENENTVYSANGVPILTVIRGKEYGGTWMHRWLAIEMAMWLDCDFKLWILEKIDYLFTSYGRDQRKIALRIKELEAIEEKIIEENPTDKNIIKLSEVRTEVAMLQNRKRQNTRNLFSKP